MERELYPELAFGSNEHVPSAKLNAILRILEAGRRYSGPFDISKLVATSAGFQPTATGYYIQLNDNPWDVGGVNELTPPQTRKAFQLYYYAAPSITTGFVRWDNMYFISGQVDGVGKWYVHLTSGTKSVGTANISFSGVTISESSFSAFRFTG